MPVLPAPGSKNDHSQAASEFQRGLRQPITHIPQVLLARNNADFYQYYIYFIHGEAASVKPNTKKEEHLGTGSISQLHCLLLTEKRSLSPSNFRHKEGPHYLL